MENKMKKTAILALALLVSAALSPVEAKKKEKKDKKAAATEQPVQLKTSVDTLSYVAGMTTTQGLLPYLIQSEGMDTAYMEDFYRGFNEMIEKANDPKMKAYSAGQSIAKQLNSRMLTGMKGEFKDSPDSIVDATFYRGFMDALKNDTTHFKVDAAQKVFAAKREADKAAKEEKLYGANREAGVKFLAENAKKDSVVVLPSGLQYKVLVKGEGDVPKKTDKVKVNYEGRLIDGTVFDASSKHGSKPATFRADQVIKGWTEALTMMPVGSKWQLFIPQELAYGNRNMGEIKPFSTLIFDVELVDIDRPEAKKATTEVKAEAKDTPKAKASKKTLKKKK